MMLLSSAVTGTDSFLLAFWEAVLPWRIPLILAILLVVFRGFWAERLAEAAFIFRKRLESLEGRRREKDFLREFRKNLWGDIVDWRKVRDMVLSAEESPDGCSRGAALKGTLAKIIADLRYARPFVHDAEIQEAFARWEEKCAAAAGETEKGAEETLEKLFVEEIFAFCAEK